MTTHAGAWRRTARAAVIVVALVAVALVPNLGCSYFVPHTTANVSPFADQIVAMSAQVDESLGQGRAVYTRHLATGPEVTNYKELLGELQDVIKGIVAYSFQVVIVAESGLPDEEKAHEMAKFLDGLRDRMDDHPSARFSLSAANIDTIIAGVRRADDLVASLRAAQPLADDAGHAAMAVTDDLKVALAKAEDEIMAAILERNAAVFAYSGAFRRQHSSVLYALALVDEYWKGDFETFDALRDSMPIIFGNLPPTAQLTVQDVSDIERRLFDRLHSMDEVRQSLEWDLNLYIEQIQEIDRLVATNERALGIARLALHMWIKKHRELSEGITKPATFDMLDITKSLVGSVL